MEAITLTKKAVKSAKKSLDRKRPNKSYLKMLGAEQGKNTPNQNVALETFNVKNALQRINNRALSEDKTFTVAQCAALKKLMKTFVSQVNEIV